MDIDKLLQLMISKNGSDLFITADVAPSMKVNGKILPVGRTPLSAEQTMRLVKGVMTPSQRKEFEETNECQFAISDEAQQARFRVSAFVQRDMAALLPSCELPHIASHIECVLSRCPPPKGCQL